MNPLATVRARDLDRGCLPHTRVVTPSQAQFTPTPGPIRWCEHHAVSSNRFGTGLPSIGPETP